MIISNIIAIGISGGGGGIPPIIADFFLWSEPDNIFLVDNTSGNKLIWR